MGRRITITEFRTEANIELYCIIELTVRGGVAGLRSLKVRPKCARVYLSHNSDISFLHNLSHCTINHYHYLSPFFNY